MKFSSFEVRELTKSWAAISLAFAILLSPSLFTSEFNKYLLISALTVGLGFILHELGHKYVAQRYHYAAEFRAFNSMLLLAIAMSFFGFILAAPGAVMIKTYHLTKNRNGKISAAGPLVNILLAIVFLALTFAFTSGFLSEFARQGLFINAWIGLFNMIPFMGIDGQKILAWNKLVYALLVLSSLGLLVIYGFI